jgi:protein gp37
MTRCRHFSPNLPTAIGALLADLNDALAPMLHREAVSGGGARPVKVQWVRDVIADCRDHGVAVFHKQWGTYPNNPLVAKQGMTIAEAKALDHFGKGGGLVDGELVREFPARRNSTNRDAA